MDNKRRIQGESGWVFCATSLGLQQLSAPEPAPAKGLGFPGDPAGIMALPGVWGPGKLPVLLPAGLIPQNRTIHAESGPEIDGIQQRNGSSWFGLGNGMLRVHPEHPGDVPHLPYPTLPAHSETLIHLLLAHITQV